MDTVFSSYVVTILVRQNRVIYCRPSQTRYPKSVRAELLRGQHSTEQDQMQTRLRVPVVVDELTLLKKLPDLAVSFVPAAPS